MPKTVTLTTAEAAELRALLTRVLDRWKLTRIDNPVLYGAYDKLGAFEPEPEEKQPHAARPRSVTPGRHPRRS
jgi:hypothetical protein